MIPSQILVLCTTLVATHANSFLNPNNDPMIGAALERFDVTQKETAEISLQCGNLGSRCVFQRDHFASVNFGSGQKTVIEESWVWAGNKVGDVLTLGACVEDGQNCVVTCNANCTCAYTTDNMDDPASCMEATSIVPTPAPKTAEPVYDTCPKKQFTRFCGELMANGLPLGIDTEYDCFNFCGGVFVGYCDFNGNCGNTDCANMTGLGSLNGQVFGCTLDDRNEFLAVNGGVSSASSIGAALLYAFLVAGLQLLL